MSQRGEPMGFCIHDPNFQLEYCPNRVINEFIVQASNNSYFSYKKISITLFRKYFIYNSVKNETHVITSFSYILSYYTDSHIFILNKIVNNFSCSNI